MYKGVRFLICHPMVYGLVGSTVVAYELADYLLAEGADVLVYTYYVGDPMLKQFDNRGISITTDPFDERLTLGNFDYIWVHSQVIPESIILELATARPDIGVKFIYLHMSIMDWIPDEKSYIWKLEEKTSSKTLFAWKEVEDKQRNELLGGADLDFGIYQNPAPKEFSLSKRKARGKLKSILFIGNQLPTEVIELQELFEKKGFKTVRYSSSGDNYDRITPELLDSFDVVVTGSKSVYYCLCAGVPVYIYNYFGRQGYVNDKTLDDSIMRNFSGRGYNMTSAEEAYEDLTSGYDGAVEFYAKNRKKFIELFSIDKVLPSILNGIKVRDIKKFDKYYTEMVVSNQKLSKRLFINESERILYQGELDRVRESSRLTNEELVRERDEAINHLDKITHSRTYKVGRVVTLPLRTLKSIINKRK